MIYFPKIRRKYVICTGQTINTEVKKLVVSIKHYFDRNDLNIAKPSVEHTACAAGIGVATVKRIRFRLQSEPKSS